MRTASAKQKAADASLRQRPFVTDSAAANKTGATGIARSD